MRAIYSSAKHYFEAISDKLAMRIMLLFVR